MRSVSAAQQTEISAGRVCRLVRFILADSTSFGVSNHNKPLTVDGTLYEPGFVSGGRLRSRAGVSVDNQEFSAQWLDAPEAELLEGHYDDALVEASLGFYALSPPERLVVFAGNLRDIRWDRDGFRADFHDILADLGKPIGRTMGPGCPVQLGSQGTGQCNVDLSTYEVSVSVTAVDSGSPRLVFSDSALGEADDWFADGEITWTGGANAGATHTIELYASNQFTLQLPAKDAIQVGDTGTATPGCDRTPDAGGCLKFNNRDNYQGFPFARPETEIP